jgi:hypothetical protein
MLFTEPCCKVLKHCLEPGGDHVFDIPDAGWPGAAILRAGSDLLSVLWQASPDRGGSGALLQRGANMTRSNQSCQPTPGGRPLCFQSLLARRGCTLR